MWKSHMAKWTVWETLGKWSWEHRGVETIETNASFIGDDGFLLDLCIIKIISLS